MKFFRQIIIGIGAMVWVTGPFAARADVTNAMPDFDEVYGLIRQHLAGETPAELNQAAARGLLTELHSKVRLMSGSAGSVQESSAPLVVSTAVYDGPIGYVRVGRVGDGLADKIKDAYKDLSSTNQLEGLVLDLRFADNHDYLAAVAVANLFLSKEEPLIDCGDGLVRSKPVAEPLTLPVTVLVNHETAAAAEALAAMLRETQRALILGNPTAGEATIDQEFPLNNGQRLRIATSAVKLGNGDALSTAGVIPDIPVTVSLENEKAYMKDPFAEIPRTSSLASGDNANGTNHTSHTLSIREADLIRLRKAEPGREIDEEDITPMPPQTPDKPFVQDPVLARALDLIKGISVLNTSR